jgi:hypothetical protein
MKSFLMRVNFNYLAYGFTGFFVTLWTLLRFYNRPSIYDLVTQQLVAREWLHGNFNPITLGKTHYLFKTIFLYIPAEILPGSPKIKLILLTIGINLVTFALIAVLLKKILNEFKIQTKYLSVAMLWLSTIAGSVFWISFANSRNLEIVGGMYILYLGLLILKKHSNLLLLWLSMFSGMLFFADTLQIYMTALPLIIYAFITNRKRSYIIGAAFLGAIAMSKYLFLLASHFLHLTFDGGAASFGKVDIISAIKSAVVLFAGSTDAGRARVLVNILVVAVILVIFVNSVYKNKLPTSFTKIILTYAFVNEVIYIISGQAHESHTSRYLIMLVPLALLVFTSIYKFIPVRLANVSLFFVIAINASMLSLGLYNTHKKPNYDEHLMSVARYLNNHSQPYAFASMDTALPLSYYRTTGKTKMSALACADPTLVLAKSVPISKDILSKEIIIPIVLDGNKAISNSPHNCNADNIADQFGQPVYKTVTDDNSIVLYYPSSALKSL